MNGAENPRFKVKFVRNISLFDAVMVGVGGMIAGSIFALLGFSISLAGPAIIVVFVLNGLVMLMTAFSYAELCSMLKEAGGGYRPVDISMPPPFGFLAGWMAWFARTVACALYLITFGTFFIAIPFVRGSLGGEVITLLLPGFGAIYLPLIRVFSVAAAVILILINYLGTSLSKTAENALTLLQLIIIAIFVTAGLVFRGSSENFQPFFVKGFDGIIIAMGLMYVTFEGSELITTLGEEIRDPERNIPRAIFISLSSVVLIYILITVAAIATTPWETLASYKENAMIIAAENSLGIFGVYMIIIGGAISALSGFNSALMASSRVAFAMGRRGHLPPSLGVLHRISKSPTKAVLFSGSIILLMVIILPLETIAASASLLFLISFILVNISLIVLRRQRPSAHRGFRVPLYPLPPIIAIAVNAILAGYLFTLDQIAWYIAILWIESGLIIYYISRGKKEAIDAIRTVAPEVVSEVKTPSVTVIPLTRSISRFVRLGESIAMEKGSRLHLVGVISVSKLVSPSDIEPRMIRSHMRKLELMCGSCSYSDIDYELAVGGDVVDAAVDTLSRQRSEVLLLITEKGVTRRQMGRWITRLIPMVNIERILILGEPKSVKTLCLVIEGSDYPPLLKTLISHCVDRERSEIIVIGIESGSAKKISDDLIVQGFNSSVADIKPSYSSLVQMQRILSRSDAVLFVAWSKPSVAREFKLDPRIEVLLRTTQDLPVILYIPAESMENTR